MEAQLLMHGDPYSIKNEDELDDDHSQHNVCSQSLCPDMLFMPSFPLQFCSSNNNIESIGANSKNANGRALAADRKRPYPCNLCPSRFGSKMELEEHQNSHTGHKPFECDVCKSRFNRRSTLWNHKRIHSDAKPFVCGVCQMQFKWKNSLKCHKDMHVRKNETTAQNDSDLRQLTYATAAKRRLMMEQEEGVVTAASATVHTQPLITTSTKKNKKSIFQTTTSSLSALQLNSQPLQASSLIPPSDHQLDLDTSPLDTLVNNSHSNNLIMQLYSEMDPRQTMLSGVDDSSMISGQVIGDIKLESPMNGAQLNVLPMQLNMFNFTPLNSQQLPSVHHLTSTSLPSVSVADYGNENGVSHPQYVVTAQPSDIILSQQGGITYQQPMDPQCVIVTAGGQEYVNNYVPNYPMLSYQMQQVNDPQQQQQQQMQHQQQDADEKIVPYESW